MNIGKFPQLLVIALLAALLYGQFFNNPIVFDDLPFFMLDEANRLPIFDRHFSWLELRSLPYASLAWSAECLGLAVTHFRVENLLLHLAVAAALFMFILRLSVAVLGAPKACDATKHKWLAAAAAVLFVLHPVATYAVGYLVQRTMLMGTLFSLLAMLAYLYAEQKDKPWCFGLSAVLYYFAVFSKEHLIMLPAVMLAMTVLLHSDWRAKLKKRWWIFLAMGAVAALLIWSRKSLIGEVYEPLAADMLSAVPVSSLYLLSVLTQAALFFKYVFLWVLPNTAWMAIDMREPFAQSLFSAYLWAALAYLTWGVVAIWLLLQRGKQGIFGFALLFPWLMFFTEFTTVRVQESFVLYRSYIWAVGGFILVPLLLEKLRGRMAWVLMLLAIPALTMLSMERLKTFSHPVLLWDDAEKLVVNREDLPGAYRIYYNRGTELIKLKQYDKAIADFRRAIELNKNLAPAYSNMGAAYHRQGNYMLAVASFDQAIQVALQNKNSPSPRQYYGRAMAFEAMGNMEKAREDYGRACQMANIGCDKVAPVAKAH